MGYVSLCLVLIGSLFIAVEAVSVYRDLSGVLQRPVRQSGFGFGNQQMAGQNPNLRTEIADSINVQKPNLNRNIGATSSTSISNAALINKGSPSLKLGQGLGVAISIQGPEGAATNDTFANTQMFNTGPNDFGQTFANAGNVAPGINTAQTGSQIHLQGDPNGFGQATSFNKANVNMFNAGRGGNGGRTGSANAMSDVNGR